MASQIGNASKLYPVIESPERLLGSNPDGIPTLREREEQLAAELAGMARLQQVSTRLVVTGDTDSLLQEIVEAAIAITAADMGSIQLLKRDTGQFELRASYGFDRAFVSRFCAIESGVGCCGLALKRGQRVIVEDVRSSPILDNDSAREGLLEAGVRAVQSTPVVSRSGTIVGMLSTHYRSPRRPADRDLRVLDLLARQAADWIERAHAEEALRHSKERFRRYFELGLIGMAIISPSQAILEVNDKACEILGYRRGELMQMRWSTLTHRDDMGAEVSQFDRVLSGACNGYSLDKRWVRKDGTVIDTTICVNCVRRQDRSIDYFVALLQDITERKRAERALRESETKFRTLADASPAIIWFFDPNGHCRYVNRPFLEFFGRAESAVFGEGWHKLLHPEDAAAYISETKRAVRANIPLRCRARVQRHDGKWRWIESQALPHFDEEGRYLGHVGHSLDITDTIEASAVLRDSEERYRTLISQVKDYAIFSTDENGFVTSWNEGCARVLGYAQHEFIGLNTAELFTPEDREDGVPVAALRQAAEVGTSRNDRWMLAKDGRRFFAMGATAGLRDALGRLTGFSTVMRDTTQMKLDQDELAHHGEDLEKLVTQRTDELARTTERLRFSERMASIGTLSAGLGHDLGNLQLPLAVRIKVLLEARLPPELHEQVIGIQTCTQYLQRISNGLRLLANDPSGRRMDEMTELGSWWNDASMVLKNILPRGVSFEHNLPEAECWVAIGRAGLTQAVFNLVQNAADSLREREGGSVSISAEDDPRSGFVALRVIDDGPGMTEEVQRRCMEPYFSTKTRAFSTGMGLPFVHALVTGARGRIEISSRPGRGTTISLLLPRPAEQRRVDNLPPPIAVVELKDMRMRSFVRGELRALGFDVRKAGVDVTEPRVVVGDAALISRLPASTAGRSIQLIVIDDPTKVVAAPPHAEVVSLGPNPGPDAIHQSLRRAAQLTHGAAAG